MTEFKSQFTTTIEQSKRLVDLGVNPETADCFWMEEWKFNEETCEPYFTGNYIPSIKRTDKWINLRDSIPAWSLHRLIEMVAGGSEEQMIFLPDPYDELIEEIAGAIKEGYFPKEYLV